MRRFFKWLESKAYKMHIRVLLSKYRAYTECTAPQRHPPQARRHRLWKLDGKSVHDLVLLPLSRPSSFSTTFDAAPLDEATDLC